MRKYTAGWPHIILTELQGLTVIEVVRARVARAEPLRVQDIADDLRHLGVDPGGQRGEYLSALRQWLQQAGVLSQRWEIDHVGIEKVLGASVAELRMCVASAGEHR